MKALREMAVNRIYLYDVAQPSAHETVHALSADGLTIEIAATVLFVLCRHGWDDDKEVGPDYVMRVVRR